MRGQLFILEGEHLIGGEGEQVASDEVFLDSDGRFLLGEWLIWGDEPFVDGEEEEERWRGEDDGESWTSRTWRRKSVSVTLEMSFILPDSSACPGYLWRTLFDTAPSFINRVMLTTKSKFFCGENTLVTSTPSLSSWGSWK